MLSNHCNVTGLLRLLQVNIQLFKIIKWTWRLPLKTGFAQIPSRCPKNLRCRNFGGAAAPLAPPGPYAYECRVQYYSLTNERDWPAFARLNYLHPDQPPFPVHVALAGETIKYSLTFVPHALYTSLFLRENCISTAFNRHKWRWGSIYFVK